MAANNQLLTSDIITKDSLMVLHEKLTFVGSINRQFDDSFARTGAKIGDTLRIRKPARYTVTEGATLSVQDSVDENTSLTVDRRFHVGMDFTTQDLTMNIEEFRDRYIEPAMSVLAAHIEDDVVARCTKAAQNAIGTPGTIPNTLSAYLDGRVLLNEALAPKDRNRNVMVSSRMQAVVVDALKGLFQDDSEVSRQYREGMMGRAAGLNWMESEYSHTQTNGTHTFASTSVNANVTANGTDTIVIKGMGNALTVKAGERFTVAGVFDVHPETKKPRAVLKQFVVLEDATSTAGGLATLKVSPSISFTANGRQNVTAAPAADAAVTWTGTAGASYTQGLVYHRDAFTFASADLDLPNGVDMASRQQYDGISLRLVRDYNINSDVIAARIDVLYGVGTLRGEHAVAVSS